MGALIQHAVMVALSLRATTYGHGEHMCGEPGRPVPCADGAQTASGEPFDPAEVTAAVPAPPHWRMRPVMLRVRLRGTDGPCVWLRVNDKAAHRWQGERGLDLTPAAVRALGATPHRAWSNEQGLEEC